jgi:hypothetical protein
MDKYLQQKMWLFLLSKQHKSTIFWLAERIWRVSGLSSHPAWLNSTIRVAAKLK